MGNSQAQQTLCNLVGISAGVALAIAMLIGAKNITPSRDVQALARHSSIAMTQRYIEVSEDACRRVVG